MFRCISIVAAGLFVLVHGLAIYAHGLTYRISDLREWIELAGILAVSATLLGASVWYIASAMILALAWMFPTNFDIAYAIVLGIWGYSDSDIVVLAIYFLPAISLIAAFAADGRWQKAVAAMRSPLFAEEDS